MPRQPAPPSGCPNKGRILIVDDTLMQRRVLSAIVEGLGYHAVSVEGGAAAVAMCLAEPFDAVLMDIRMPGMDGLQTTRAIRAGEGGGPPIIGVSSECSGEVRRLARRAGMIMCLEKPVRPAEIADALHAALVAHDTRQTDR